MTTVKSRPASRLGVARGADDFRVKTQTVIDSGADLVKIIASGAVFAFGGVPGEPEMTPEEIAAVVEVAHAAGVKVTAHAHGAQSIKDAILAGVDSIEHASLADDEAIALAAERGIAFSMDVYNGTYTEEVGDELGYPEEFMQKNEETTEAQRLVFEKAYKAGVPILYGTDAGVSPHGVQWRGSLKSWCVAAWHRWMPSRARPHWPPLTWSWPTMSALSRPAATATWSRCVVTRCSISPCCRMSMSSSKAARSSRKPLPQQPKFADTVYHTGKIYTVNAEKPWAQAVAIRNGKIAFVGTDDAVRSHIGPDTVVHDLRSHLMLPAFQDAHIHPVYGALEVLACDLSEQADVAGYRVKIAECAAQDPDKEWLTGGAWSMAAFGPGARASKLILDELVPDRPTYLRSADGHTGWANSRALEIAGITRNTPDPADGIIDRDPDTGDIVGSLQEGAMKLVEAHVPPPDLATRIAALKYARDMLHAYGITSVQDAYAHEEDLETYEALDRAGELQLRVVAALLWDNAETEEQIPTLLERRKKYLKGNVRPTSVKIFVDGVMENYTAVMLEPYLVPDGTRGIPMIDPEFMKEAVSLLDAEGFQVHFHSLGDGAVRYALDAVETALDRNGNSDRRHHLSHLQVIQPDDIPRFHQLTAVANFQPAWAYADEYVVDLTLPFIESSVARWMYPIKSVIDAGGRVAFGSDWNVSTANPMLQIETAITRVDPVAHDTEVMNPEQRITLEQAIRAFTINAAFVNHQDDSTGSIEKGKLADLIVIDRNLFEIEPAEISDANVLLTLFAGEPVYGELKNP